MSESSTQRSSQSGRADRMGTIMELLSDECCRVILRYLQQKRVDTASISEILEFANYSSRGDVEGELAIRLHHVTIPKLEEIGIVDYDPRQQMVRYRKTPLVESVLEDYPTIETRDGEFD